MSRAMGDRVDAIGETSVGGSTVDRIMVQGFDLSADVIGKANLGDMLFLLVGGRLPTPGESAVFNAVLVSIADHGITPNALAARLTYTGAPEALQGAVAAGLLGIGGVILGVAEETARLVQDGVGRAGGSTTSSLRAVADVLLDEIPPGTRLPGIGHPIHKAGDPRLDVLFSAWPASTASTARTAASSNCSASGPTSGPARTCR